jgi:predicted transcriptional regulator
MKSVLLSVRPRFARSLMTGTKTAEVRRRFPNLEPGTELFIYSSSPDRAVIGTLILKGINQLNIADVWATFGKQIEIESTELDAYLEGSIKASILGVRNPDLWDAPVSLSDLREKVGLEPAQSWRYLDANQGKALRELGAKRTSGGPAFAPSLEPALAF